MQSVSSAQLPKKPKRPRHVADEALLAQREVEYRQALEEYDRAMAAYRITKVSDKRRACLNSGVARGECADQLRRARRVCRLCRERGLASHGVGWRGARVEGEGEGQR